MNYQMISSVIGGAINGAVVHYSKQELKEQIKELESRYKTLEQQLQLCKNQIEEKKAELAGVSKAKPKKSSPFVMESSESASPFAMDDHKKATKAAAKPAKGPKDTLAIYRIKGKYLVLFTYKHALNAYKAKTISELLVPDYEVEPIFEKTYNDAEDLWVNFSTKNPTEIIPTINKKIYTFKDANKVIEYLNRFS